MSGTPDDTREWAVVDGRWCVRPPHRPRLVPLSDHHTVTDHGDGTITVSPSIVYSTPDRPDYWHGWLRAGKWSEA